MKIEWKGIGTPDLPEGTRVHIWFKDGRTISTTSARNYRWSHTDSPGDIVAYEVADSFTRPNGTPPIDAPAVALPLDPKARKDLPIFSGFIRYFPDAMVAVAELSRIGNDQHNPGKRLHWDRSKSGDELDALSRHLVDAGTLDSDKVRHSTKVAWRAMANLQKEIETERSKGAA